jgi:hypothetical protein
MGIERARSAHSLTASSKQSPREIKYSKNWIPRVVFRRILVILGDCFELAVSPEKSWAWLSPFRLMAFTTS